jgi:hypothetical protein
MRIVMLSNVDPELLGLLPSFLHVGDPRSAREQFDANYAHGGGWNAFEGHKLDPLTGALKYPGDPRLLPLAVTKLRDETIYFYENAWVCIVQPNGSYEVARMD